MPAEVTVGVVIPAYNAAEWLEATLDSVLAQPYRPIDIVVVDDGSTDATQAVAQRYAADHPEERVVVASQVNGGAGAARNHGVALVRGDLIGFHDADDLCTPEALTPRVRVLRSRPDVDIAFGGERRFAVLDESGPVALEAGRPSHLPGSMLIRRSAFERVGAFASDVTFAEGLDWLIRARELGLETVTVPEQIRWRRVHSENRSRGYHESPTAALRLLKASLDRRRAAGTDAS